MFTSYDREYLRMRFDRIEGMVRVLLAAAGLEYAEQETIMATLEDLTAAVAQQSTVIESVTTLLDGLAAQLAAAGVDPAKLDELKAGIEANTERLAAAVARHTDADDEVHAAGM